MIRLHPVPDADHPCPYCHTQLEVKGWYIPGMRNLADLACRKCEREFYGDLPSGHGLHYPMLLEKSSGAVHDRLQVPWFAEWLYRSFAERRSEPVDFTVEEKKPIRRAILLNCLDCLYGHCLLKLLNASYYLDHRPDFDLIVLVPRFLRWLVPDGVALIWTIDLPLNRGIEWNDWLAREIRRRVETLGECYLSVAYSHPHPDDFEIEKFSRVKPFPLERWEESLQRPIVTFIWREDRFWHSRPSAGILAYLSMCIRRVTRSTGHSSPSTLVQSWKIVMLANRLRKYFASIDFAVAGLGRSGKFPDWILDLRFSSLNEAGERTLCERYAHSHVVIGIHGSNMLLPSAHAGAIIELMPEERWGNILQDLLFREDDQRETLFRYRVLPLTTSIDTLCQVLVSLLTDRQQMLLHMQREWCKHGFHTKATAWRDARLDLARRWKQR